MSINMENPFLIFDESSSDGSLSLENSGTTNQSTITIGDSSLPSTSIDSSLQAPDSPVYNDQSIINDLPGLNPSSERLVELHHDVHTEFQKLMINADPNLVGTAAEVAHGESNNIPFLESIVDDLARNGVQSETYVDAMAELAKFVVQSPLEQFAIFPLIPMNIGDLYFSFTNPSLFMLLTLSLVLLLVHFVTKNGGGKPKAR